MVEEVRSHSSHRPLEAGARLGGFELLAQVGQGGMGAVWVARPVDGDRPGLRPEPSDPNALVAVKTILPHDANDPAVRAMFLDEARVATLLRHPNACTLIDYGNDAGTLYMVMEWVDGDSLRSLAARSDRGDMPWEIALRIVRRVCDALHAAHELRGADGEPLGLVHRDVSPHNVLVSATGDVKLIDFGIAKTRARMSETTNSGVVKGKLRYLAPEQVDGSPVDRRADVWALGAVLWSLVCGEELYGATSEAEIFRTLVMRERLPSPPPGLPPMVVELLQRALVFDRAARFPSARAMRLAIDVVLGDTADDRAFIAAFAAHRMQGPIAARRTTIDDARAALSARRRLTRSRTHWRHAAIGALVLATLAGIGSAAFASRTVGGPAVSATNAAAAAPKPAAPPASEPLPTTSSAPIALAAARAPEPSAPPPARAAAPKKRAKLPQAQKPRGAALGAEFDTHD